MGRHSKYPEEFRRESVQLVLTTDKSMADVARDLGINYKTLGNWVRADQKATARDAAPGALSESERSEFKRLRHHLFVRIHRGLLRQCRGRVTVGHAQARSELDLRAEDLDVEGSPALGDLRLHRRLLQPPAFRSASGTVHQPTSNRSPSLNYMCAGKRVNSKAAHRPACSVGASMQSRGKGRTAEGHSRAGV
jgi:transposase